MEMSPTQRLAGKVAIVTGAADGTKAALGALFARALAAEGAGVAVADMKDCASVVADIEAGGGKAIAVEVDVRDPASVAHLFAATDKAFGRLDILVNNAVAGSNVPPMRLEDLTVETWDEFMAVNVRGTFLCTQAAVAPMRRNGYGKIINLSSAAIRNGLPYRLPYLASKGAIATMTRSLARELGEFGIRVNTIAPGLVMNDAVAAALAGLPGQQQAVLNARSIKEHLYGNQLVGTLLYLAAPDSDAVSGQFVIVDNGADFA